MDDMDQLQLWYPNYPRDLERVRRFWAGEGRCLVSVTTAQHNYRQIFDDSEMMRRAVLNLEVQAQLPGVNLPFFCADLGTISTAKYWGGRWREPEGERKIFIDPAVQTLDEALSIQPRPADDPDMDFAHGLRLYHQVCARLETSWLWLRSPDMQGPLTTAGLMMNQENLLMAMVTDKNKVHRLLDKITRHLIEIFLFLRRETGGQLCGNLWPFSFFPADLGLSYTEDLMPLLSPTMYREFGLPYMRMLAEASGGLLIHCCGDWGRHARNLADANLPIRAVEFHYPFTKIEELRPLADQAVIIPYIVLEKTDRFASISAYYRYLLENFGNEFRFWFACAEDTPELVNFAKECAG
jgi:hypothetical protein